MLIFEIRIEEKVGMEGFQIFWPIAFVTHRLFVCSICCLPLRDLSLLFFRFAIYNSYCSCCSWSCFVKVSICMQEEEKCLEHMEVCPSQHCKDLSTGAEGGHACVPVKNSVFTADDEDEEERDMGGDEDEENQRC